MDQSLLIAISAGLVALVISLIVYIWQLRDKRLDRSVSKDQHDRDVSALHDKLDEFERQREAYVLAQSDRWKGFYKWKDETRDYYVSNKHFDNAVQAIKDLQTQMQTMQIDIKSIPGQVVNDIVKLMEQRP